MRHSLRAVSLWGLIVVVPIMADAAAHNKAPIARNDAATTAMDTSVTINVTANDRDRDGRIVRKTVRIVGGPRHGTTRKQRNGRVIYTPNPGFSGQDTFRYRVKDNDGATSNAVRVRVTVLSARPPVANNDSTVTAANTPVVINVVANDTDADGNLDPATVAIVSSPANGGVVNNLNGTVAYTPAAAFFGTDSFTYTVNDAQGATSNVATVTVAVNAAPAADAGPDANAVTGLPVTLNGSASSHPDGNTLAFSWRFLGTAPGSNLADTDIVNRTTPAPIFTPDVDGAYELELTVTDPGGLSDTASVLITAAATGQVAPNAAAGPDQNADVLTLVTLNGSASNDPDGGPDPLTFSWAFAERPSGSTATLTNAMTAQPSFTPDVTGLYRVTLTVSDGALSDSDDVDINVTPANVPPNAAAGPDQNADVLTLVTLNGSASNDPDGGPDPLTFSWAFAGRPSGSTATLTNATTAQPSFTPDVPGVYLLRLDVFDGEDTDSDQVMVTANAAPVTNVPPEAVNDARSINEDQTLAGAGTNVLNNDSDADGDPLTAVPVSGPSQEASFTLNPNGTFSYTPSANFNGADSFTYRANDGTANSNVATVTITVNPVNDVPSLNYANNVHPIFSTTLARLNGLSATTCTDCHTGATASGGLNLDASAADVCDNLDPRIDTGTPANSLILRNPSGDDGEPHGGGKFDSFTNPGRPDYDTILNWIAGQGGFNDVDEPASDMAVCP